MNNNSKQKIEKIKSEYEQKPKEKTNLDKLRELDNKVKVMPRLLAYILGSAFTLIFGLGLTFTLEWNNMLWGVVLSAVGISGMISAYFIYKVILEKRKDKYREQILTLASKLLNEER